MSRQIPRSCQDIQDPRFFQEIQEFKIFLRSWQDIQDVERWVTLSVIQKFII